MAQAVFDSHPLGDYLRDAGESPFVIPGISSDIELELDEYTYSYSSNEESERERVQVPEYILHFLKLLQSLISIVIAPKNAPSPFVEQFKYSVISSSLLSPSLSTRQPKPFRNNIPGKLQHHSRTSSSSVEEDVNNNNNNNNPRFVASLRRTSEQPPQSTSFGSTSMTATASAVFFSLGYPILALFSSLATVFFIFYPFATSDTPKHDMSLTFNALQDLLSANDSWESTVQDTITFLEEEEERSLNSTTVPSPIRVALHSCLQSTHTQCDSIRHLFSALTSPTELPQIAEMYAPPSPKTALPTEFASRPFSYPSSSFTHKSPPPTTPTSKKRLTWSGSYLSLADAGSPTNFINRRRERTLLVHDLEPVPVSPNHNNNNVEDRDQTHFGAAALDLQRKRKSIGLNTLRSPPITPQVQLRSPPFRSFRNSIQFTPGSKFTNPIPSRHPLSFTALTFSLQGAISSKRYACAHLLALRFSTDDEGGGGGDEGGEDDNNGYWEDVRSVIGLLTSALVDASSRLGEALDEAEQKKLDKARFDDDDGHNRDEDEEDVGRADDSLTLGMEGSLSGGGFAPVPSQVSRFAAHVAAITAALDDAKDQLEQCVAALKSAAQPSPFAAKRRRYHGFRGHLQEGVETEEEEPKALVAYERLRRELGLALRECERGRERLMGIVYPPLPLTDDDDEGGGEEEEEDVPALAHDASSESDKLDPISPRSDIGGCQVIDGTSSPDEKEDDDATEHLLMSSTVQHLPLPGIEEVFEAETGVVRVPFRERTKVSREERIRAVKAMRESGSGGGGEEGGGGGGKLERWGPGGEVVQELKDVIWKVGERRRMRRISEGGGEQDPFLDSKEK